MNRFDYWLKSTGAAALVIREALVPVEGPDGVFFPATFAADEDPANRAAAYNIDAFPEGTNVCTVDGVAAQAKRIEPLFAKAEYAGLIPQITITAGDRRVNLVAAGAGAAVLLRTALHDELEAALKIALEGNAEPLAKIAPTWLVFGAWDSQGTQARLPWLVSSTIRAFNVRKLSQPAQYVPAAESPAGVLLDPPGADGGGDASAERGLLLPPAPGSGGVIALGGVRRDVTFSLAALRQLAAGGDAERTLALERYILGLALLAFTAPHATYLRQGCNLVNDPDRPREIVEVHGDGRRVATRVTHDGALTFARSAAEAFGVGPDREVAIDRAAEKNEAADRKAPISPTA